MVAFPSHTYFSTSLDPVYLIDCVCTNARGFIRTTRVKSGNFGHQVNLDIPLQTVEIQM